MSLTRSQFDSACKAYIHKYSPANDEDSVNDELLAKFPAGWSWNEHKLPGFGYLARTVSYPVHAQDLQSDTSGEVFVEQTLENEDDSAAATVASVTVTCRQYVVFSSTFQVPAFYFSIHRSTGAPLPLQEIIASPLFRSQALPTAAASTFALETPDSAFALLSQGDHPTLGMPCWYLHPCHTAEVVEEIMREADCADKRRPLRWLEAWFMMLGNIVDFGEAGR